MHGDDQRQPQAPARRQRVDGVEAHAVDVQQFHPVPPEDPRHLPPDQPAGEQRGQPRLPAADVHAQRQAVDGDSLENFLARQRARPTVRDDDDPDPPGAKLVRELAAEFLHPTDVGIKGAGEEGDGHGTGKKRRMLTSVQRTGLAVDRLGLHHARQPAEHGADGRRDDPQVQAASKRIDPSTRRGRAAIPCSRDRTLPGPRRTSRS